MTTAPASTPVSTTPVPSSAARTSTRFTAPAFSLNVIQVATPCTADWDAMTGTDRARYCGQCDKHVYNLSAMSEKDALALIEAKAGHLCIRMFRREDGSILTQDCPVGVRAQLRAAWVKSVARVAALAVFGLSLFSFGCKARGAVAGGTTGTGSVIGLEPTPPTPPIPVPYPVMGMVCPTRPTPPPTLPTPTTPPPVSQVPQPSPVNMPVMGKVSAPRNVPAPAPGITPVEQE